MKSKDIKLFNKKELVQKFQNAMQEGDEGKVSEALAEYAEVIQMQIINEARQTLNMEQLDASVLAQRGVRQLTQKEKTYYNKVIEAMRSTDPKQALADLRSTDGLMPETIIESVFTDLIEAHPLLNYINFQNTTYITEWIFNKHGKQIAKWGEITAEVEKELTSDFQKMNMILYSLTAFIPISKSMLELGPVWVDKYIRTILSDAIAAGLVEGIVNGTGVDMPIGMNRDLEAPRADGEEYKKKNAIKVTEFSPTVYGNILSKCAKTQNGRSREISHVIMIVNPFDYLTRVMPATTYLNPNGSYVNNVLPFPTDIIQCSEIEQGKTIVGLADKYFMGLGSSKEGIIQYSDEYKFLQRERIYLSYLYGNGRPLDNNAFVVLDISELKPITYKFAVEGGSLGE